MKTFLLIISSLFFATTHASHQKEDLKLVLRFQNHPQKVMARDQNQRIIPLQFASKELENKAKGFKIDQEVLIHGHISYQIEGGEEGKQLNPVLFIEELHPISLKELGAGKTLSEKTDTKLFHTLGDKTPATLPVSGDVANAITMTASLLMLQDLIPSEKQPGFNPGTNAAIIFSAGAMATGVFIYQQLKKSKSQRKQK